MFKQALLPGIQSGNRDIEICTHRQNSLAPFEVGNQGSKHEAEAELAVGNYDVGEQCMSNATGHAFKTERPDAGFDDIFPIVRHKDTVITAIWGKFPRCAAARASFVMVAEAVGSFLEDDFIRQFFKHGLA